MGLKRKISIETVISNNRPILFYKMGKFTMFTVDLSKSFYEAETCFNLPKYCKQHSYLATLPLTGTPSLKEAYCIYKELIENKNSAIKQERLAYYQGIIDKINKTGDSTL